MPLSRRFLVLSLSMPVILATVGLAPADEHQHDHGQRRQEAHVHGIGRLNLVIDGQEAHLELQSPAANIVGFEHAPSSEADHAAVVKALAQLEQGDRLFQFNGSANCSLADVQIASDLIKDEHDEHSHDDEHERDRKPVQVHEGHEEHEEHEEHGHERHADVDAVYRFHCARPEYLEQLSVELFASFPATERLEVQYVAGGNQGAEDLTAAHHILAF